MSHKDLIKNISTELNITQEQARQKLDDVLEVMFSLADDGAVNIPGFGTFKPSVKKSRKSFNPKQKYYMTIPPKRVLKFLPSNALKSEVEFLEVRNEQ